MNVSSCILVFIEIIQLHEFGLNIIYLYTLYIDIQ